MPYKRVKLSNVNHNGEKRVNHIEFSLSQREIDLNGKKSHFAILQGYNEYGGEGKTLYSRGFMGEKLEACEGEIYVYRTIVSYIGIVEDEKRMINQKPQAISKKVSMHIYLWKLLQSHISKYWKKRKKGSHFNQP